MLKRLVPFLGVNRDDHPPSLARILLDRYDDSWKEGTMTIGPHSRGDPRLVYSYAGGGALLRARVGWKVSLRTGYGLPCSLQLACTDGTGKGKKSQHVIRQLVYFVWRNVLGTGRESFLDFGDGG